MLIQIQAYDSHCNLVLGEVEETIYAVDEDDEDEEVKVHNPGCMQAPRPGNALTDPSQTISRKSEMLFVRGERPPVRRIYDRRGL